MLLFKFRQALPLLLLLLAPQCLVRICKGLPQVSTDLFALVLVFVSDSCASFLPHHSLSSAPFFDIIFRYPMDDS